MQRKYGPNMDTFSLHTFSGAFKNDSFNVPAYFHAIRLPLMKQQKSISPIFMHICVHVYNFLWVWHDEGSWYLVPIDHYVLIFTTSI